MRFNGTGKTAGFRVVAVALALVVTSSCQTARVREKEKPETPAQAAVQKDFSSKELGLKIALQEHELANGLKLILIEDHTVPVVSYQTWYRAGSVDEKLGTTGIAHLFEHLMFKGTPKYGPKEFFLQLEAKGAEVNAYTTRDYTVYYENIVPDLLEKVIDMESDRMANLKITPEQLNSERMVVLEERRMRTENSPEGRMQEALWELAYRYHPYQWPVIGYPQDLGAITVEDLNAFFRAHYQPANATVVIAGDIQPAKAVELMKKYYEPIPAQPKPERKIEAEPQQREERRLIMRDHAASQRFAQAYHVTSAKDDDSYALDVLANILFAGTSSRAYRKIVDQADVALGVSGVAFTPTYPGLFMISGTMKQGVPAEKAEALLDQLIREVQDKGVTEDEVKVAVRQLTVQMVDGVRTANGLATLVGTVQTVFGNTQEVTGDLARYLKVKPSDVQRVAREYLIPNNRSVVTMVEGLAKESQPKESQ